MACDCVFRCPQARGTLFRAGANSIARRGLRGGAVVMGAKTSQGQRAQALAARVRERVQVAFELEPHIRFEEQPGEQWTMFVKDPSGNCLEFKAMTHPENLFAKYVVE